MAARVLCQLFLISTLPLSLANTPCPGELPPKPPTPPPQPGTTAAPNNAALIGGSVAAGVVAATLIGVGAGLAHQPCDTKKEAGCCYSYGHGAMMKPCCLETHATDDVTTCKANEPGHVGGESGYTKGSCPATAEEAAALQAGTRLTAAASPGDKQLQVDSTSGFAVGDRIVIDQGSAMEEKATIQKFGTIDVEEPIQHPHAVGAPVAQAAPEPPAGPSARESVPEAAPEPAPVSAAAPGTPAAEPGFSANPKFWIGMAVLALGLCCVVGLIACCFCGSKKKRSKKKKVVQPAPAPAPAPAPEEEYLLPPLVPMAVPSTTPYLVAAPPPMIYEVAAPMAVAAPVTTGYERMGAPLVFETAYAAPAYEMAYAAPAYEVAYAAPAMPAIEVAYAAPPAPYAAPAMTAYAAPAVAGPAIAMEQVAGAALPVWETTAAY